MESENPRWGCICCGSHTCLACLIRQYLDKMDPDMKALDSNIDTALQGAYGSIGLGYWSSDMRRIR